MKQLVLITASLLVAASAYSQPWITRETSQPQKLADIVDEWEQRHPEREPLEERANGKIVKEGKDYHFRRWVWYWEQQLDQNGYMVSPVKMLQEWNRYKAEQASSGALAKITTQADWTFEGPSSSPGGYNGIGRINVVAFHPTDTNTFIIGSAGGGAWRTEDGGLTWTSLYDFLPVLGVSDIDYNPKNPSTIYLCTGEKNSSDTYSIGLMKSTDGGLTWNLTGLQYTTTEFKLTTAMVINPLDTNSLTVTTSDGIFKSLDAGNTWAKTANGHFRELVYHPADTNILYTATYSGVGTANIFRSTNGGQTWSQVTNLSGTRRIALAVTPADPNAVKAIVAENGTYGLYGIYHSSDSGASFTRIYGDPNDCTLNLLGHGNNPNNINNCNGQGWYDLCIAVNPTNPQQVLIGGVNTWQSLDGGYTWDLVTRWSGNAPGIKTVHADKHYFAFHPLDPNLFFECNDGGIYKTFDPGSVLWTDISNGLGITQFYRNGVANTANFVIGGSQDNGSKRITFANVFSELTGGDGMDCHIDPFTPTTFYTSIQFGSIRRTTNNGANFTTISDNIPGNPEGEWITPFVLNPLDPNMIVAGYSDIYVSTDQGDNWADISNFTTNGYKFRRIAMTPANPDRIYVLYGNTVIRYTDDFGGTWSTIPGTPGGFISDLQADYKEPDRIWVTYSGYNGARVATFKLGTGWTQLNNALPNIPVNCIALDSSDGTAYIGTDVAVFYMDTTMTDWALYNTNLPVVKVTDLGINYTTNEIWAATYGRGMWKSTKHVPPPGTNLVRNIPFAPDVIRVAPNPNKGHFAISSANPALQDAVVEIRIVNYSGITVMKQSGRFSGGMIEIGSGSLSTGSYIVEVIKNGYPFARTKMVVH